MSVSTATVYYVKPDDGESCPYQHCHVLQYYTNKQLDSHSQLHFLSGTFHLSSDFVVRNVHNISLTGSKTANSTPNTIIQCNSSVSIVMINITGLIMRNMVIKDCGPSSSKILYLMLLKYTVVRNRTVTMNNCSSVHLHNLDIRDNTTNYGLLTISVMGYSLISEVTCNGIIVVYNNTQRSDNCIEIKKHHFTEMVAKIYRIVVAIRKVNLFCIKVSDTNILQHNDLSLLQIVTTKSMFPCMYSLQFTNCTFNQNTIQSNSLFYTIQSNSLESVHIFLIVPSWSLLHLQVVN